MSSNTSQAIELQAMLPDRQATEAASSALMSTQQASEFTAVQMEPLEEGNSCCLR